MAAAQATVTVIIIKMRGFYQGGVIGSLMNDWGDVVGGCVKYRDMGLPGDG